MDTLSILIGELKAKKVLTELESDILDTVKELERQPFDRSSAEHQMTTNYTKHCDIYLTVGAIGGGTAQPSHTLSDEEVKDNLGQQLPLLVAKEWEAQQRGE